jgi:hypothetical protein
MINIFSLRCSLAFAPYLSVSTAEFLQGGSVASRVVRQGGTGLIVRQAGDLVIRHEGHQVSLGIEDARHYAATIKVRQEFYDVSQMQGEIVQATVADEVLLSHPESEIRLTQNAVGAIVNAFARQSTPSAQDGIVATPDWLSVSAGGGTLLLSDQRTGRWVLLGDDHVRELERRSGHLCQSAMPVPARVPPTITMKGLTVHLQSAFRLVSTLTDFASNESVTAYKEIAPTYSLAVSPSAEGLELKDADNRITLTAREARKWADIIQAQLETLNAQQFERQGIRTVIAGNEEGHWILQWGDEVFVSRESGFLRTTPSQNLKDRSGTLTGKRMGDFSVLLSTACGSCVALTGSESECLEALLAAG